MASRDRLGKYVGKTDTETDFNTRRLGENFPLVERTINSFNKLMPFRASFQTRPNAESAFLNIYFREYQFSCAVSPPILDVQCSLSFSGVNTGGYYSMLNTTANVDKINNPPNPDFTWTTSAVTVPLDGCYFVRVDSGDSGPSYFSDRQVTTTIFHNGVPFKWESFGPTGILILLGPGIYFYSAPSPLFGVVDCKAGDTISVAIAETGVADPIPWYGTSLSGYFLSSPDLTTVSIKLVATAETDVGLL